MYVLSVSPLIPGLQACASAADLSGIFFKIDLMAGCSLKLATQLPGQSAKAYEAKPWPLELPSSDLQLSSWQLGWLARVPRDL